MKLIHLMLSVALATAVMTLTGCNAAAVPDNVQELLWRIAVLVLTGVAIPALPLLAKKLDAWLGATVHNTKAAAILERLNDHVFTIVSELAQTMVDQLKNDDATGKLTSEEAARVKNLALTKLKEYLGPKGLAELASVFGMSSSTIDSFLSSKIESAVYTMPRPLGLHAAELPKLGDFAK